MLPIRLPTTTISPDSLKSLQPHTFRENNDRINGLSFSDNGDWMTTSSNDDSIVVFDLRSGRKQRKVNFPKTGAFDVKYLHSANSILLASRKNDGLIKHFSLHDNKCIRFFKGHDKPVTQLAVSPEDDLFMSGSSDYTVRLWDVRVQETLAALHLDFQSNIAFDPEGLVFAVSIGSEVIKLFDKRMYNNGPFSTFDLSYVHETAAWTSIAFSPDGLQVLLVSDGNHLRLLDSFTGTLTTTLTGHSNEDRLPLRACFTPCSKYVICGGSDGTITFWLCETGKIIYKMKTDHAMPINIVDFNPKYHMMASACNVIKLWTPNSEFGRRIAVGPSRQR